MKRFWLTIIALLTVVGLAVTYIATSRSTEPQTIFGRAKPTTATTADTRSVELGVAFSSNINGMITGIRFYKGRGNVGEHIGSLWSRDGTRLGSATFSDETASGWQTTTLEEPVNIVAGATYVASYLAPLGRYAAEIGGLAQTIRSGSLTVPAGGGRFAYGRGAFPRNQYQQTNYYVDVTFEPASSHSPSDVRRVSPGVPSSATDATAPPLSPSDPIDGDGDGQTTGLALPQIPWEGGPKYWKRFSKADAAGWDSPKFFPIVVWYNGISSDAEVRYDKSLGINTYIGMWAGTPHALFEDNDVFWIGSALNGSFTANSKQWVGNFLDDEVDGRFTPAEGRAHLQKLAEAAQSDGRFDYANFTQSVISNDMSNDDAEQYVNDFTDAVSLDMYWYTIPHCDLIPYRNPYLKPVKQSNCRTASSYGKAVASLRARDEVDGSLQPLWQFVENVNGGPAEGPFVANISGDQLKGAVMSSLINEARGIVYFNQSFTGPCQGSAIFRQSQAGSKFCGAMQVAAAKQVNLQVKNLAPVLNTQSFAYHFGDGLDTMLKAHEGWAYVFAMIDGETAPGQRTLALPAGMSGKRVDVLGEGRSLEVDSKGVFTDHFSAEYSYHIYKVKI